MIGRTSLIITLLFFFIPEILSASRVANLLIYPFKNNGDNKHDWISSSLTDSVMSDLKGINGIRIIPESWMIEAINRVAANKNISHDYRKILEIGKTVEADLIFHGSYSVIKNRIRVHVRLISVNDYQQKKPDELEGELKNPGIVQNKIAFHLIGILKKRRDKNFKPIRLTKLNISKIKKKHRPDFIAHKNFSLCSHLAWKKPAGALEYCKKAIELDPKYFQAKKLTARILSRKLKKHHQAINHYRDILKSLRKLGRHKTLEYAETLSDIGTIYNYELKNPDEMKHFYIQELNLRRQLKQYNDSSVAHATAVAIYYKNKRKYRTSIRYYRLSITICKKLGILSDFNYRSNLGALGRLYKKIRRYHTAVRYLEKALFVRKQLGESKTRAYAVYLSNIAVIYFKKLKQPCTGASRLKHALRIMKAYDRRIGEKIPEKIEKNEYKM